MNTYLSPAEVLARLLNVGFGARGRVSAWAMGACAVLAIQPARSAPALAEAETFAFTDRYCSSCHNDVDREGGLDGQTAGGLAEGGVDGDRSAVRGAPGSGQAQP